MRPKFLYFDLGKVLLDFDVAQMCRQMGEVAGVDGESVQDVLFAGGLQRQYETGQFTSRQFYRAFCEKMGLLKNSPPDYDALTHAGNDIFQLNLSMLPVVAHLRQAGYRLGILSNTCESHWEHCFKRYRILSESFSTWALSYRIEASKPEPAIFRAAAELADCPPEQIFFTDDIAEHVAGAKAAGFDAVQYLRTPQLVAELRERGIRFNY